MVAICACAYNPKLKSYYKKKLMKGKIRLFPECLPLSNRGLVYVDLMKYEA
jgi:transposase